MTPEGLRGPRLGLDPRVRLRPDRFRCSVASEARGEQLTATASTVRAFVLLEEPGPWGPALLRCHRVPDRARRAAAGWERRWGVRPLLIRRPERSAADADGPRRVFVVNAAHGWAQSTLVDSLDEVAGWDLSGVRTPDGVGLEPWPDPLLLVCTHGRHDACCAERGRPLATALAERWPAWVWESSHLGGDRFAANLLVLPDGDAYGRLDPSLGPAVVAEHLGGRVSLAHHRGRTTIPWVAQAAEMHLRRQLDEVRRAAVSSRVESRDAAGAEVTVFVDGVAHPVRVDVGAAPAAQLTCTAGAPAPAPTYGVRGRTAT